MMYFYLLQVIVGMDFSVDLFLFKDHMLDLDSVKISQMLLFVKLSSALFKRIDCSCINDSLINWFAASDSMCQDTSILAVDAEDWLLLRVLSEALSLNSVVALCLLLGFCLKCVSEYVLGILVSYTYDRKRTYILLAVTYTYNDLVTEWRGANYIGIIGARHVCVEAFVRFHLSLNKLFRAEQPGVVLPKCSVTQTNL